MNIGNTIYFPTKDRGTGNNAVSDTLPSANKFSKYTCKGNNLASLRALGRRLFSYATSILLLTVPTVKNLSAAIEVISISGDTVGSDPSYIYESYSTPSLNKWGELAFAANVAEFDSGNDHQFETVSFYNWEGMHLIAAKGQLAPRPGDDKPYEYFDTPELTESGITMFRGRMEGSVWDRSLQSIWLGWTVTQSGETTTVLDVLARAGEHAIVSYEGEIDEESGKFYAISKPITIEPRSFAFHGDLYHGDAYDDQSGLWFQDARGSEYWSIPRPQLLSLTSLPLRGQTLAIENIESYSPIDTAGGYLLARLKHEAQTDLSNDLALWRIDLEDDAQLVTRTGDLDTSTNANFISIGQPVVGQNDRAYFWASVLDEAETEGIYESDGNGITSLLNTQVPLVASGESFAIASLNDPIANSTGDIAVLATLETAPGDTPRYAIFYKPAQGIWSKIATSGQQAPGALFGVNFKSFSSPILNPNGQLAFTATLEGQGNQISDTTDTGVWATDANGMLSILGLEGETIDIGGNSFKTISSLVIGGFNDSGKVALRIGFSDDSEAIALSTVELAGLPKILSQPSDVTIYPGMSSTLSVKPEGLGPYLYQWFRDGSPVEGETEDTITLFGDNFDAEGEYTVSITTSVGTIFSAVASANIADLPYVPQFVEEPASKIALLGSETVLKSSVVSSQELSYQWYKDGQEIDGATNSNFVVDKTLSDSEGQYHVVASAQSGAAQSDPVEILVTDRRMINISTRAMVGTGANVLSAGFVIDGPEPKTVLLRGIGPTLSTFGLQGNLEQPMLQIKSDGQVVASNSGWAQADNQTEIQEAANQLGAFPIETSSEDAAMLVELQPGAYSAILSGENQSSGIGLIEVYEVNENLSRMVNISSRAYVGSGIAAMAPGLVVEGDTQSRILIRAVGPSLAQFNLSGLLEYPVLDLIDSATNTVVASNETWHQADNALDVVEATELVGGFPLQLGSQDAALLIDLEPGVYTVRVSGKDGTTGIALVEAYAVPY